MSPISSYLWPPEAFLIEVKRPECEPDRLSPVNLRSCNLSKQVDILTSVVMYCSMQQWLLNFVPPNLGATQCYGRSEIIAFCKGWQYTFHSLKLAHRTICSSSQMFQGNRDLILHWHSTSSAARQRSTLWCKRSMYLKIDKQSNNIIWQHMIVRDYTTSCLNHVSSKIFCAC